VDAAIERVMLFKRPEKINKSEFNLDDSQDVAVVVPA